MNWRRRFRQWKEAVRRERGAGHPIPWFKMFRGILTPVPRAVWRRRMRYGCLQCHFFDKDGYICRGVAPHTIGQGCGCYVVFAALHPAPYQNADNPNQKGCWAYAKMAHLTFVGWPEYFMRPWEWLYALPRFLLRK